MTGFTVEYVRDDWVYGFQLDGDHLYLLKDFTVSHNTACSMDIIAKVGKKTLVVVTKEDIRDQWVDAAKKFLGLTDKDIGFIQADKSQVPGKKLVIAMIQSLAKEDRYPAHAMKEFGLAIWDECIAAGGEVLLGDGISTTPIEVLVDKYLRYGTRFKVMSYNERTGRWEPREVTHAWVSGVRDVIEVSLSTGGKLVCTEDHLVFTSNRGWVKAGALLPDDDLVVY